MCELGQITSLCFSPHLNFGKNGCTYLLGVWQGLNEIIHTKSLEQNLAQSSHSASTGSCFFIYFYFYFHFIIIIIIPLSCPGWGPGV